MPRLAWFTPTPPCRSGVAVYSAELLPLLSPRFEIDVFTSPLERGRTWPAGHPPVFEAHDFVWKHFLSAYDLVVYQLGSAACHAFIWPFLFRRPGLVVLHDAELHRARARELLGAGRMEDYAAEFRANHPNAPEDVPELVIRDLADTAFHMWPMLRLVVERARLAVVHAPRLADDLSAQFDTEVARIRMGVADPWATPGTAAPPPDRPSTIHRRGQELRTRLGLRPDAVVFAVFGLVTPEKRVGQILRALPEVARAASSEHLLLVGDEGVGDDLLADAARLGVADRVTITGRVPDDELPAYLAAADVCLCLRWPTGRETSASWLRALAAGRATVVTKLSHIDEAAYYDPRTWRVERAASTPASADKGAEAVSVGVDILDEHRSLVLAMTRLATEPMLRERLGRAGREYWARNHTLSCMADDYVRVLARALSRPAERRPGLPPHLEADGTETLRRIATELGVEVDFLRWPSP